MSVAPPPGFFCGCSLWRSSARCPGSHSLEEVGLGVRMGVSGKEIFPQCHSSTSFQFKAGPWAEQGDLVFLRGPPTFSSALSSIRGFLLETGGRELERGRAQFPSIHSQCSFPG